MHELSIAMEIIAIVQEEMDNLNLTKVETVNLRLGVLTGVNPDALSFGFEASVVDTRLDGARLVIEEIPIRGRCRSCGKDFEVAEFMFLCPHCSSTDLDILTGEELDIDHLVGS